MRLFSLPRIFGGKKKGSKRDTEIGRPDVVEFIFVEESQLVFSLGAWLAVKSLTGFLFEPRPRRGDLYARTCPFIMHVPCACQRVR